MFRGDVKSNKATTFLPETVAAEYLNYDNDLLSTCGHDSCLNIVRAHNERIIFAVAVVVRPRGGFLATDDLTRDRVEIPG